jgi:ATP-binding cassette subfamily B protein
LERADRLVVLERGRVVEEGTHAALMAAAGAYFKLYEAQARNAAGQDPVGSEP